MSTTFLYNTLEKIKKSLNITKVSVFFKKTILDLCTVKKNLRKFVPHKATPDREKKRLEKKQETSLRVRRV